MALSIQISDADFTQVIASLSLPDRSGLVAEYTFGESDAKSIVNRAAPGLASMTLVGSPVYGSNYAEIKSGGAYGSVGFNTGVSCPTDATMIVVVRKKTALPVFFAELSGTYDGFLNYTSAPALYNNQSGTLSNVANVAVPAHTDFAFFAGRMPKGQNGEIYTYASGVLTTDIAETAGGSGSRGVGPLLIGTSISNGGSGVADIAYAALFERVLSAAEVASAYASLKAYLATRGVTVS
jgi:hypothetical protein